ncbi:ribosome maturation factor RimP [Neolewinella antarctica]|uniref:Ribosome maturation factor RimP n=1 Tax=Neolewinella antarctica TaxID=442734 RepID=A0ABX0XEK8_9BACT|nr:hypothetical protein [Neolewinella antarctica]NJC27676.1 ribosome maturation factor RimP [Neolewinella antarctica]
MVEKITKLLENFIAENEEFGDAFVVDVHHTNTKVDIYVDSDSPMTFEKCRTLSRHIEAYLDAEQPLGEKYTLNVSSPGVDRPLKFHRQYVKNKGRTLEVTTNAGDKYKGELISVTEEGVVLSAKIRRKEGKRKVTVVEETPVAFADIKKSIVKISF